MKTTIIILNEIDFYRSINDYQKHDGIFNLRKVYGPYHKKDSALNVFNYNVDLENFLVDNLIKSEILDKDNNILIEIMPDQPNNL
jgi:hypothetical protein